MHDVFISGVLNSIQFADKIKSFSSNYLSFVSISQQKSNKPQTWTKKQAGEKAGTSLLIVT